jgi:hypothetical protein
MFTLRHCEVSSHASYITWYNIASLPYFVELFLHLRADHLVFRPLLLLEKGRKLLSFVKNGSTVPNGFAMRLWTTPKEERSPLIPIPPRTVS